MGYENKTVDYVYNLLLNSFQEKFNNQVRLLPKSFLVVLAKVLAAVYVVIYKLAGWLYLQLFPDTASFERIDVLGHSIRPLVKLGVLFGVGEPQSGQAWQGVARMQVVSAGRTVMMGTQLKSEKTGCVYATSLSVTTDGESVDVAVYCTQQGTVGNLEEGDELKFVSPLGFVERTAVVKSSTQVGADSETEAHYRARVVNRYSSQPQGGALSDYRMWAFDAPGVLQTYPYNGTSSPGDVVLYVAGTTDIYPDRVPGRELCVAVGEACTYDPDTGIANRKPLTAVLDPENDGTYLNVKPVKLVVIDVKISDVSGVDAGDFGASCKSTLSSYLLAREPYIRGLAAESSRKNQIQVNSLIALANSVAESQLGQFGALEMEIGGMKVESYTLGNGELAKLGKLYVNGVEHEG